MKEIIGIILRFIGIVLGIFWVSFNYDFLGFQKEFPFVEFERLTSDDRDRVRRISELKQEKLALMREIEEEQRKRQIAEDESREANNERRKHSDACDRRERDWLKEKNELKTELEEERGYRRRCEDEKLKLRAEKINPQ